MKLHCFHSLVKVSTYQTTPLNTRPAIHSFNTQPTSSPPYPHTQQNTFSSTSTINSYKTSFHIIQHHINSIAIVTQHLTSPGNSKIDAVLSNPSISIDTDSTFSIGRYRRMVIENHSTQTMENRFQMTVHSTKEQNCPNQITRIQSSLTDQ